MLRNDSLTVLRADKVIKKENLNLLFNQNCLLEKLCKCTKNIGSED